MSLLDYIWDFFRKPKPVFIPDPQKISGVELGQILKPYCSNLWLSDSSYSTINKKSIEEFLKVNPVSKRAYLVDAHDCDDYSFELMGDVSSWNSDGAFGIVWGNRAGDGAPHAWNFFIDELKTLWYAEPQTDKVFRPSTESIWIMII